MSYSTSIVLPVIATVALAFLLLPMCQYIIRPCTDGHRMSLGCCGRFTAAELLSFTLSITIVCIWVLTGHWLLMDAMVSRTTHLTFIMSANLSFNWCWAMGWSSRSAEHQHEINFGNFFFSRESHCAWHSLHSFDCPA